MRNHHRLVSLFTLALAIAPLAHAEDPSFPQGASLSRSSARRTLAPAPDDQVTIYVVLEGPGAMDAVRGRAEPGSAIEREMMRRHLDLLRPRHANVAEAIKSLGGSVQGHLFRLANAIQAVVPAKSLDRLLQLSGVLRLDPVPRYDRALTTAVPFVGAPRLWGSTPSVTGSGVRVGVVDTGIDYLHADLGGPGTPEAYQQNDRTVIEPGSFPTAKVMGGRDFVGDEYNGTNGTKPDDDPLDCAQMQSQYISGGHGTHVSGIIAGMGVLQDHSTFQGPYLASYDPALFRVGPGVAPEASLYALKIFGCDGSTTMVAPALEWAVDPNEDGDLTDRLDVINMSLGGAYGLSSPTDETVIRNLTAAGTVVVVAAGNDGDTFYVTGEPATYSQVISVAATTDLVTYLALQINAPSSIAGDIACAEGGFTKPLSASGPISGQMVASNPSNGCAAFTNPAEVQGKIVLVDRGSCYFATKAANATTAGAAAIVIVNNVDGDPPFVMGGDGSGNGSEIPGVMIANAQGKTIRGKLSEGVTATLDAAHVFQSSANSDERADFSSRGPRSADNRLKPDLGAPGFAIESSGVASGWDFREMSGTSMACPMVAGGAALVRQANPSFTPFEVKAALMNTSAPITDGKGHQLPMSLAGAGRMQVDRAAQTKVTAAVAGEDGDVSVSFGSFVTATTVTDTRDIVLTNRDAAPATLQVTILPAFVPQGVVLSTSETSVQVPANGTATVTLALTVDPSKLPREAPDPYTPARMQAGQDSYARHFLTEASGLVTFHAAATKPEEGLRVPFHAAVRAGSERKAGAAVRCENNAEGVVEIPIEGPSLHQEPLTTAFELGTLNPKRFPAKPAEAFNDLRAIGVATNLATVSFDKASVYFGLAVDGEWTTPAQGQLSVVGVAIDTTNDKQPEYAVFAEAMSRDAPYADVLAATTYDLGTGQALGRRYLNLLPRDQANTEPFNNGVVILPVALSLIGLTENASKFAYYGFTQGVTIPQTKDQTAWVSWDPAHPAVDTAREGSGGIPFYPGYTPIQARLGSEPGAPSPSVLLLHHSNVRGQRYETVDLGAIQPEPAGEVHLALNLPSRIAPNAPLRSTLTVTNAGSYPAKAVRVEVSVSGAAEVEDLASDKGTCTLGASLHCTLGELAAGESAELTLRILAGSKDVHVMASSHATPDCDGTPENNYASATASVDSGEANPPAAGTDDTYRLEGGCACTASGKDRLELGGLAGWAAALALAAVRRRRR